MKLAKILEICLFLSGLKIVNIVKSRELSLIPFALKFVKIDKNWAIRSSLSGLKFIGNSENVCSQNVMVSNE